MRRHGFFVESEAMSRPISEDHSHKLDEFLMGWKVMVEMEMEMESMTLGTS